MVSLKQINNVPVSIPNLFKDCQERQFHSRIIHILSIYFRASLFRLLLQNMEQLDLFCPPLAQFFELKRIGKLPKYQLPDHCPFFWLCSWDATTSNVTTSWAAFLFTFKSVWATCTKKRPAKVMYLCLEHKGIWMSYCEYSALEDSNKNEESP